MLRAIDTYRLRQWVVRDSRGPWAVGSTFVLDMKVVRGVMGRMRWGLCRRYSEFVSGYIATSYGVEVNGVESNSAILQSFAWHLYIVERMYEFEMS